MIVEVYLKLKIAEEMFKYNNLLLTYYQFSPKPWWMGILNVHSAYQSFYVSKTKLNFSTESLTNVTK